jgi:hypothetical protein
VAFVDPSAGGGDSFTVAIAHREDERAVLDVVRERRPPFSPAAVVEEYAELLLTYGVADVVGDRWGGEFLRNEFRKRGIDYQPSALTRSDIYRELLGPINAGRVELLDVPRLLQQFTGLERRARSGGRDAVDHRPGGHDDLCNAAAGALLRAVTETAGSTLIYAGGHVIDLGSANAGPGDDF